MSKCRACLLMTLSTLIVSCGKSVTREIPIVKDRASKDAKGNIKETDTLSNEQIKDKAYLKWHLEDLDKDGNFGVSSELVYSTFNILPKKEIIVAVIDSGVDHQHEDLKDVMWINEDEVPGNGIDDDKNGYIDDIHGWNFLGGKDQNINDAQLEQTRIYKTFLDKLQNGEDLSVEEAELFERVRDLVEKELQDSKKALADAIKDKEKLKKYLKELKKLTGLSLITSKKEILALPENNDELVILKGKLLELWNSYRRGFSGIDREISMTKFAINVWFNVDYNQRAKIVGDDPSDFTDTNYGNNDVKGADSSHGTHVAGIIAANRYNNIGMKGIASNVRIMSLRAVPNGDERDKDIALAVRYAVDNGANIINMSFGKSFSLYKTQVDEAFKYAAKNGVLLIHAAGNSALNIDGGQKSFPNTYIKDGAGVLKVGQIANWIEVGASTRFDSMELPAIFSNYGKESVSLFAPGHKVYSTTPENTYAAYSGTSMATPVVAGVAALVWSQFPTMTAGELKEILEYTVSERKNMDVLVPSRKTSADFTLPMSFDNLSQTGGIVNAFQALSLAKVLAREN